MVAAASVRSPVTTPRPRSARPSASPRRFTWSLSVRLRQCLISTSTRNQTSSSRSTRAAFPDGYGEADLRSLAFIDACQDFIFHGKTGRGKTHLAIAIGASAVRAGKSVRFFTVAQLVMHLADARDRGGLRREIDDLLSADLLTLNELGYVPLDVEGARLLFQVMSAPEGTQSLIVATNIESSSGARCSATTRWPLPSWTGSSTRAGW